MHYQAGWSDIIPDLSADVTDVWLFFVVIIASGIWLIYLTFYNSRFLGWIFSKVLSKVYNHDGNHLSFDSFSINILGGKLMFRNLRYSNTDYSVTVNDGYVIFRWWLPHQTDNSKHTDQAYRVSIILKKVDVFYTSFEKNRF